MLQSIFQSKEKNTMSSHIMSKASGRLVSQTLSKAVSAKRKRTEVFVTA